MCVPTYRNIAFEVTLCVRNVTLTNIVVNQNKCTYIVTCFR